MYDWNGHGWGRENDCLQNMKKKYIGKTDPISLINGKAYEILSVEEKWYRVIDETGDDYLYPPELFCEEDESRESIDITYSEYIEQHLMNVKKYDK